MKNSKKDLRNIESKKFFYCFECDGYKEIVFGISSDVDKRLFQYDRGSKIGKYNKILELKCPSGYHALRLEGFIKIYFKKLIKNRTKEAISMDRKHFPLLENTIRVGFRILENKSIEELKNREIINEMKKSLDKVPVKVFRSSFQTIGYDILSEDIPDTRFNP